MALWFYYCRMHLHLPPHLHLSVFDFASPCLHNYTFLKKYGVLCSELPLLYWGTSRQITTTLIHLCHDLVALKLKYFEHTGNKIINEGHLFLLSTSVNMTDDHLVMLRTQYQMAQCQILHILDLQVPCVSTIVESEGYILNHLALLLLKTQRSIWEKLLSIVHLMMTALVILLRDLLHLLLWR